jgi:hypothetical protein
MDEMDRLRNAIMIPNGTAVPLRCVEASGRRSGADGKRISRYSLALLRLSIQNA